MAGSSLRIVNGSSYRTSAHRDAIDAMERALRVQLRSVARAWGDYVWQVVDDAKAPERIISWTRARVAWATRARGGGGRMSWRRRASLPGRPEGRTISTVLAALLMGRRIGGGW